MVLIQQSTNSETLAELTEGVQSLHNSIAPDKFKPFDKQAFKNHFDSLFEKEGNYALLATIEGSPVGYLFYNIQHSKENAFFYSSSDIYLNFIAVLDQHKRQEIANRLMEELKQIAVKEKVQNITLSVWTQNSSGRDFFKKMGFEEFRQNQELKVKKSI